MGDVLVFDERRQERLQFLNAFKSNLQNTITRNRKQKPTTYSRQHNLQQNL